MPTTPHPWYYRFRFPRSAYSFNNVDWTELRTGGHVYSTELQNPQVQLLAKKINDIGGPQMTAEFD